MHQNKNAVIYHYYEVNEVYRDNLFWFLLLGYKENLDFYIILTESKNLNLPVLPNITYIHTKNIGFDYGGYCEFFTNYSWQNYEKIVFLISSTRGPIIPAYVDDWFECFTKELKNDVGITGTSINILNDQGHEGKSYRDFYKESSPFCHVQTNAFALNNYSLSILDKNNFWNNKKINTKLDTVIHFEIRLSQILLQHGLNLKCLLSPYNNVNYRVKVKDINKFSANGDVRFKNCYFGHSIDPYQTMFVSTNRKIFELNYLNSICLEQVEQSNNLNLVKTTNILKWLTQKYINSNLY